MLSWAPGTDAETPAAGLTYNLRVGTTPGGVDVVSPLADPATGARAIFDFGNAGSDTRRRLRSLSPGTYYWSVQSVDNRFAASPFAREATFTVSASPP